MTPTQNEKLNTTNERLTSAIYLTREDHNRISHIAFLYDNEIIQEKLRFYVDENTPLIFEEDELTHLMRMLPENESWKDLRNYLQRAGNNIFRW